MPASALLEPLLGLPSAWRQARGLSVTDHRPWPLPERPWVQGQSWEDLLFAHWPVEPGALRSLVPAQLPLDVRDGSAWLGITPFVVRALRMRVLPPLVAGSRFAELNVRTYVTVDDRPGIFFFSLDAASRVAVAGARAAVGLPYFHAQMSVERSGDWIEYSSERRDESEERPRLAIRYRPTGPPSAPRPGSLEHFLTERYCAYRVDGQGRVVRLEIHHPPWPLQPASAEIEVNTMARPLRLELGESTPLLHFARRQDVVVWPPRRVDG